MRFLFGLRSFVTVHSTERNAMSAVVGTRPRGARSGVALALMALVASLLVAVGNAPAAKAHASLSNSSPRDGAALKSAPRSILLNFNETITFSAANVQILNASAAQIPVRVGSQTIGGTTRLTLTPAKALGSGRFAVRYSVTSADGHVIAGALAFSVNATTATAPSQTRTLSDRTKAVLSGAKVGSRSITLTTTAKSGVIELTHPSLGAPLRWKVMGTGKSAKASGVLPFPGTWSVTARLRVSPYTESVGTGSFSVAS